MPSSNQTVNDIYRGSCFCGEVEVEIVGAAVTQLVCHCTVCRSWSAAPMTGATLFRPEDVRITKGADSLRRYARNEGHDRCFCCHCGGHVMADHQDTYGIIDVYAAILDGFTFNPTAHINYESAMLRVLDGLPKYRDFSADFCGSGEMMDE